MALGVCEFATFKFAALTCFHAARLPPEGGEIAERQLLSPISSLYCQSQKIPLHSCPRHLTEDRTSRFSHYIQRSTSWERNYGPKRGLTETQHLNDNVDSTLVPETPQKRSRHLIGKVQGPEERVSEGGVAGVGTSSGTISAKKVCTATHSMTIDSAHHYEFVNASAGNVQDYTMCRENLIRSGFTSSSESAVSCWSSCPKVSTTGCDSRGESARDGNIAIRKVVSREESSELDYETRISDPRSEITEYFGEGSSPEYPTLSLESVAENEVSEEVTTVTSLGISHLWSVRNMRFDNVQEEEVREKTTDRGWGLLPLDIQENVFQRLEFKYLFRLKALSKTCKRHIESDAFICLRGAATSSREGSFTAINFFIRNGAWQCTGFDLVSKRWRRLPTFTCLPAPDSDLFKEYSVCGDAGLMCANVSKSYEKERLIVFNPLTGKKIELPPLHYPRKPVLIHISVDYATNSYKVIVAGSSSAGDERISRKMEVFDSRTSLWKVASDLPGPEFGLNEHQTGVFANGILYFIAFLEGDCRRGVLAYDVEKGEWLMDRTFLVPFALYSNILQLVESNGKVYLFSEQEPGGAVEQCIDELEYLQSNAGVTCKLKNVIRVKRSGGRGLGLVGEDPEYTCLAYGEGKLCIFNTLRRDGVIYDILDRRKSEILQPPPPSQRGESFFSLNPLSFSLQPSFVSDNLIPESTDPDCGLPR